MVGKHMTFIELVEAVAAKTGLQKKQVKAVLRAATNSIDTQVRLGRDVRWAGFGTFYKRTSKAKKAFGRTCPARTTLRFAPYGTLFKENTMEKLGVVMDDSMEKTGAVGSACPKCGLKLTTPGKCDKCGTEPFEKKPEQK
jgi:nucleoid DNA-binding protein